MISKASIFFLIKDVSKYLNMPAPEIFYVTRGERPIEYMAKYDRKINLIFFNEDWMKQAPIHFVYQACLHELRHAYQHMCITKNSFEDVETLKSWRDNALNYVEPNPRLSPEQNLKYLMQPLELDATAFAYFYMYHIGKIELTIIDLMKKPILDYANKKFFSKLV